MKKYFNLVEVALAIAVIGIGIAGIMAIFPVGLQSTRDAIGENYAADSADQFLHLLASACKNDWASYIDPLATPPKPYIKKIASTTVIPANNNVSAENALISGNIFSTTLGDDIFLIKQGSTMVIDFMAHLRVWKTPVTSQVYVGGTWVDQTDTNYTYSTALNLEISWPVGKPYNKRSKRYFYLEVFKPN